MKILVSLLLVLAGGCGTTCPTFKLTRCNGQIVEICSSNKRWARIMDCSQVKPVLPGAPNYWHCGQTRTGDGSYSCLPTEK